MKQIFSTAGLAAMVLGAASMAHAAVIGPSGPAFYTKPTVVPAGANGTLISYRTAAVNLGNGAPPVSAWNVMYKSTDSRDVGNVVTGTVLVPSMAWSGSGARPVMSYAVGTHGLAQRCAPSLQMAGGTDYETANIVAALKAGFAVVITDYQGYTTGDTPTYLAGASQGHAVLDIVRAAAQLPLAGITASSKVVLWGFSQGGQSASWAAQMKGTYAPELNVVGAAAGGVPADFIAAANNLDGNTGASFLMGGVIGLSQQYPDLIPLNSLASATGQAAIARGKDQCVFESLFELMNRRLSEYTVGNQTLTQLQSVPSIKQAMVSQNLGGVKLPMPMYLYHGTADEFLPLAPAVALKKSYCNKGSNVTFGVYPGEHITTQFQAAPTVLTWLSDRVGGKTTLGTCITLKAAPKANANPGGGNFVVSLKDWGLTGDMTLATMQNQVVPLPTGSALKVDSDMTAQALKNGVMTVPDFTATLKVLGINTKVGLRIAQVGGVDGSVSLDTAGNLHIHGAAKVNISITSLDGIKVGSCTTETPVILPLNFDGPVSALGSGGLQFTGTTTFPKIKGCLTSSIITSLMSGPGQGYRFTVKPPAPTTY
jgi:pimeloyl-ACP methyl ester carboxylesterase